MSDVLRDAMFDLTVARWDCGPGCGTTGCGNTPEDIRRYQEYKQTGVIPPKKAIHGEPGWQSRSVPSQPLPARMLPYWRHVVRALLGKRCEP